MTLFESNIKCIQKRMPYIYQIMKHAAADEEVYVGDSYISGQFLAIARMDKMYIIGSTYDSRHAAERWILSVDPNSEDMKLILYGFGLGYIVEELLNRMSQNGKIILYEPSPDLLRKVLEIRDVTHILNDDRLKLFVGSEQMDQLLEEMNSNIGFYNYNDYIYRCCVNYQELYPEQEKLLRNQYNAIMDNQQTNYTTITKFREIAAKCEIHSFRYLMHAKSFYDLIPHIDPDIPCIIVSAGPSLKKNVEELKAAVGKSVIFCVDAATSYLVSNGIVPDLLCTIDSIKRGNFRDEAIQSVPVAVTTTSSIYELDAMGKPETLYYSSQSVLHERIFGLLGYEMPCIHGGGSVATNAFELAVQLGFRTIILVGQDLSYSGMQSHVDMSAVQSLVDMDQYHTCQTEGYYGGVITTRWDYKQYIDWFAERIQNITDRTVVNATEGGAKIPGAVQMPLHEAVCSCCKKEFEFMDIYNALPYIVDTPDKRAMVIHELRKHIQLLDDLRVKISNLNIRIQKNLKFMEHGQEKQKDLEKLNQQNQDVISAISDCEASDMLYRYMLETEMHMKETFKKQTTEQKNDPTELYKIMRDYYNEMLGALDYFLDNWSEVMDRL